MKLVIGLSYAPAGDAKYEHYATAVRTAAAAMEHEVELVDLFTSPERLGDVDGILFTGGADVSPARYGKPEDAALCGNIDLARDAAEFGFADHAEAHCTPVFGICRGMQLLNVHRGGTLVADLVHAGKPDHAKHDGADRRHPVKVTPGTFLRRIVRESVGEVNSAHHQAVDVPGEGLTVTVRSAGDEVAEAMEWTEMSSRPFFLAVQWHPERLDYSGKFAGPLFESFVWEVSASKLLRDRIGVLPTRASEETAASGRAAAGMGPEG